MPVILVFQRMASRDVWYRVICNDLASGQTYLVSISTAMNDSRIMTVVPRFDYNR